MGFFKKNTPKLYPKKMIVGLGNPGAEYKGTRHNVGFDVVDLLASRQKNQLKTNRHQAMIAELLIQGVEVLLVKPVTFMNRSGTAVKALANHYGIKPEDILVIADDLDLATGRVRMRGKGGSGGHNGHKHLIQLLGTEEYPRIRIGIGKGKDETISHVLSRFTPEERATIEKSVSMSADACERWLTDGIDSAMQWANSQTSGD